MIDRGANPHIRNAEGISNYERFGLASLKKVPSVKSVFYPIKNFPAGNLGESWCYKTGVYDGKYGAVVGKGGEGVVIRGKWRGQHAAYKFVPIKGQQFAPSYENSVADMNARLNEMTEMTQTPGDAILHFEAHFR